MAPLSESPLSVSRNRVALLAFSCYRRLYAQPCPCRSHLIGPTSVLHTHTFGNEEVIPFHFGMSSRSIKATYLNLEEKNTKNHTLIATFNNPTVPDSSSPHVTEHRPPCQRPCWPPCRPRSPLRRASPLREPSNPEWSARTTPA